VSFEPAPVAEVDFAKAALADKLLALRLLLDNEDICVKVIAPFLSCRNSAPHEPRLYIAVFSNQARKNQRRLEIGRMVFNRIMQEGTLFVSALSIVPCLTCCYHHLSITGNFPIPAAGSAECHARCPVVLRCVECSRVSDLRMGH
jgi:hypothetical protein